MVMNMEEELYLECTDSLEGVFTGIYDAYLRRRPHSTLHLCLGEEENPRLFAVYEKCQVDEGKAAKVARTNAHIATEAMTTSMFNNIAFLSVFFIYVLQICSFHLPW